MRRLTAILMALVVAQVGLGCSKNHDDLPAMLAVTTPQTVTSLSVTNPQNFDYDLAWAVGNMSTVRHFRVYGSFDGFQFTFVDSTTSPTFLVQSFLPVASFGVSVVSTQGVEGAMVVEAAPDAGP